jgi:hypothetical protein
MFTQTEPEWHQPTRVSPREGLLNLFLGGLSVEQCGSISEAALRLQKDEIFKHLTKSCKNEYQYLTRILRELNSQELNDESFCAMWLDSALGIRNNLLLAGNDIFKNLTSSLEPNNSGSVKLKEIFDNSAIRLTQAILDCLGKEHPSREDMLGRLSIQTCTFLGGKGRDDSDFRKKVEESWKQITFDSRQGHFYHVNFAADSSKSPEFRVSKELEKYRLLLKVAKESLRTLAKTSDTIEALGIEAHERSAKDKSETNTFAGISLPERKRDQMPVLLFGENISRLFKFLSNQSSHLERVGRLADTNRDISPRNRFIYLPAITKFGNNTGAGAFAKSVKLIFGSMALKDPTKLNGKILALDPGLPFPGTCQTARLSFLVALSEYVASHGGTLWLATEYQSDVKLLDLSGTKFRYLSPKSSEDNIKWVSINEVDDILALTQVEASTKKSIFAKRLTEQRDIDRTSINSLLFSFASLPEFLYRVPAIKASDNSDEYTHRQLAEFFLSKVATVVSDRFYDSNETTESSPYVAGKITFIINGNHSGEVALSGLNWTLPIVIYGPNSSGKSELLRQMFINHATCFYQMSKSGASNDQGAPLSIPFFVGGGTLEQQLRKISFIFEKAEGRSDTSLYVDEFQAHPEDARILQEILIEECSTRSIHLTFVSNQPESVEKQLRELDGQAIRVSREENGVRSYEVFGLSSQALEFKPEHSATEGAFRALEGIVPEELLRRAREIAGEISDKRGR